MIYAEAVYFNGAHVALYHERQRLALIERRNREAFRAIERRQVRR